MVPPPPRATLTVTLAPYSRYSEWLGAADRHRDPEIVVGDLLDVERRIIFGGRPAGFEEIEEPVEPDGRTAIGGPVETVTHESFLPLKSEAKGPRERDRKSTRLNRSRECTSRMPSSA